MGHDPSKSLALSEVRHEGINATASDITPSKQLKGFWNIRTMTEVLNAMVLDGVQVPSFSNRHHPNHIGRELQSLESLVDELDVLRGPRNERAHLEPMNEGKAWRLIEKYEPKLRELLEELSLLEDMRFGSFENDAPEEFQLDDEAIKLLGPDVLDVADFWNYQGLVTEKRVHCYWELEQADRANVASRPQRERDVYAQRLDSPPVLLSPLYLSKVTEVQGRKTFEYTTLGTSTFTWDERHLAKDLEALHQCFRTRTDHQRKAP